MEYIKLPGNIAAEIEGRSSFARLGLETHMTAGFVDPGFEGVLTFEIFNAGPNPIKLYPGLRIAQIRFSYINEPVKAYNKKINAKYRGLLAHHYSLQFKDSEVKRIIEYIEGRKENN
jgi:dCTP deaminase